MASISPRSQEFFFVANHSSPGSSESVPLLRPMSTFLREADTSTVKSSPLNRDNSEKNLHIDISDIISPLIFKKQSTQEEETFKSASVSETSSCQFSYPDSHEFSQEMESPWNGKIEQACGIGRLSIDSNEERYLTSSCCCFRFFNYPFYFRLKFWSTKASPL